MEIKLIYVLLASIFSCLCNKCVQSDLVSVVDYEMKFHELFEQYWHNNRTLTKELKNTVQILQQPNINIEELPNIEKPGTCLMCHAFSYSMLNYYRNESNSNLNDYLLELCIHLMELADHECLGLINVYAPSIKFILKNRVNELSSDRICGIIQRGCSINPKIIDFKIDIDGEPLLKTPKIYDFDEKNLNSSDFITIAHLSDFHYDPYYAPGSSSDCIESICCRNTSIPKLNSTHKTGYWGDYHICDSPGHLIENICSQVASNHKNIDLIYYTGDFGDHFNWQTSRSTVKQTIEFITQQIKEKFPNIPVIMSIGNHDIHPSDAFAPEIVGPALNSKWLYEIVADLWSDWLPQSALSTLRIGGYYSVQYPHRPGFRVVVLNNNLCWIHNIWLFYGADEMITQLEWLRDTLISAEMNREKVHILGHIPPNTSTCVKAWNREYNRLIQKFAHIISGQFNGHTHKDSFTLFYSVDNVPAIPLNVAWVGGSGTSFIGLNSNYRLYTIEPNTFEVIDFDTYIFNLTAANLTPDQPPKWFKEYTFREAFGITDLSPNTLSKLVNVTFREDRDRLHKMWTFYHKMSDAKLAEGCNDDCLENLRQTINSEHDDNFF